MIKISNNLVLSAGLIIINSENKILLIKPAGLGIGHFSLPKGMRNKGEGLKNTALREAFEEIGIKFNINELGKQYVVNYFNNDILTKRVFCYLVKLSYKKEKDFVLKLQKEEVDDCTFYNQEEANELIFWRYKELLTIREIWN